MFSYTIQRITRVKDLTVTVLFHKLNPKYYWENKKIEINNWNKYRENTNEFLEKSQSKLGKATFKTRKHNFILCFSILIEIFSISVSYGGDKNLQMPYNRLRCERSTLCTCISFWSALVKKEKISVSGRNVV